MPNPKAIGEISEAVVLAHLVKQGRKVLMPFGNNQRYDMVVDDDGKFIRGQIKTARHVDGCIAFNVCSCNGFTGKRTTYVGHIDVFWVYSPYTEKVYEVPVTLTKNSTCSLRVDPLTQPQKKTTRWAKDYEI